MPTTSTLPYSKLPNPSSGAITTPNGDLHIPPSTRADGSLRKEIKIRPGYRPPEDVEVYKNRTAEAWKQSSSGGIPGASGWNKSDGAVTVVSGKNARRREARKKSKAAEKEGEEGIEGRTDQLAEKLKDWREFSKQSPKETGIKEGPRVKQEPDLQPDPEVEKEKQARNLKKKLRQARELREKKDKGESLLPEQFEKVIKIQELIRQLDVLGFDNEGVKKV